MTLDPDTALLVKRRMSERNVSFKRAINDVIRESAAGSGSLAATPFETQTASMGAGPIDLDGPSRWRPNSRTTTSCDRCKPAREGRVVKVGS